LRFGSPAGAPFPLRVRLAGFTGFHPAVVRDEGLPAPAGHHPVFRHFLGVSSTAPGIDRGLWLVQPAAVADDQGLSLVFDAAADERRHLRSCGVMLIDF
jgi:hypothetical protein